MALHLLGFLPMHFPARLIQLRKAANFTQQTLSEAAELHVNQIRRYEAGTAQPTFEALAQLDSNERMVVKELLDGMLLKHQASRLAGVAV